ncbi:MAG TPA: GIY-YIG nuclease family protein [Candidatus Dormibacteraeota bacterium]|nr:GIY-YIG nuclease family protein [Candidatus Dormibacteraeota bacterium]
MQKALELLPHQAGVYILRDGAGRVIYVGRSRDLSSRVRTYWSNLGDRPHLVRMVERVAWLEPVLCASEHEAAFLESDLIERHRSRYNRTLGMESCVWLRLNATPSAPSLDVVHEARPGDGAAWFGPYLGWEPARQAASGLQRLFPLRYSGTGISRSDRELGSSLGVMPGDTSDLAGRIERVLRRDRAAIAAAVRALETMRDRAAQAEMFEHAALLQQQVRGLLWITEPQKLSPLEPLDHDFCAMAIAGGMAVLVILALREGHLTQRHMLPVSPRGAWREVLAAHGRKRGSIGSTPVAMTLPGQRAAHSVHREWIDLARQNAELMACLAAAGAVGPLVWRDHARRRAR